MSVPLKDAHADLWRKISQLGTIDAWINAQLKERGLLVKRRSTDSMSRRERDEYKRSLKNEAAERKELKAQAWAAYQSAHIVHVGENIFWNDAADWDKWDLEGAEERAAENELPPLDSPQQLAAALDLSLGDLRWLSYHRDAATRIHYHRFTIPKRDGSTRAIWAPLPKLKAAQRWILRHIVEKLPVHGAVHGFLTGRSILSNARVHRDAQIVFKMDIKDFFPAVTLPRVKGVFRKAGYREQIATLLALLCTESPREVVEHQGRTVYVALGPRCLPQGAPTSPALTNTLCLRLDRRVDGLAKKFGWRYTRYADDLTFSLPTSHTEPPHLGKLSGLVKRIVADEGFQIHPAKTRVHRCSSRQSVTGLIVNGQAEPRVPREVRRRLRAAIHNLKQGNPLRDNESPATLFGYAAYVHMTDPEVGRRLFDDVAAAVDDMTADATTSPGG